MILQLLSLKSLKLRRNYDSSLIIIIYKESLVMLTFINKYIV
jgi:hypothetical protein